jgi:hypothetical protein
MKANFITIEDAQVIDLRPAVNNRPLALVDLQVLNKLIALLPKADFGNIRHQLREDIMETQNLEQLVEVCTEFTAFHNSVNFIKEVIASEVPTDDYDGPRVVGRVDFN